MATIDLEYTIFIDFCGYLTLGYIILFSSDASLYPLLTSLNEWLVIKYNQMIYLCKKIFKCDIKKKKTFIIQTYYDKLDC